MNQVSFGLPRKPTWRTFFHCTSSSTLKIFSHSTKINYISEHNNPYGGRIIHWGCFWNINLKGILSEKIIIINKLSKQKFSLSLLLSHQFEKISSQEEFEHVVLFLFKLYQYSKRKMSKLWEAFQRQLSLKYNEKLI